MSRLLHSFLALVAVLLLAPITPAQAVVYIGNPNVSFRVDRVDDDYTSGDVHLDLVRIEHCDGTDTEYVVDDIVDPVLGHTVVIAGGDHCGVTWVFDSDFVIDGSGFVVDSSQREVYSALPSPSWVPLSPWSVVSGTMTGGGPRLLTTIQ